MRSFARTSLGLLGLALMASGVASAQDASTAMPSGYRPYAGPADSSTPASASVAPTGLDGRAMPAAEAPHKHKGRMICAKCAAKAKMPAGTNAMPPGTIVGCEHSKNGVCTACQAALNMPGTFSVAGAKSAEAPGRAVASSGPAPMASPSAYASGVARADSMEAGMAEPAPIGVVQANFSQGGPMAAPAGAAMAPHGAMAPGRAMVESNAGRDPYQAKSGPFPRPHILGHLLGFSGIGAERAEEKARRKSESHAMISYGDGAAAPVEELPAAMVFGKKKR